MDFKLKNYVKEGQKLPMFGIGPYLIYGIAILNAMGKNMRNIRNALIDVFRGYQEYAGRFLQNLQNEIDSLK